jgi:hypothetical protein
MAHDLGHRPGAGPLGHRFRDGPGVLPYLPRIWAMPGLAVGGTLPAGHAAGGDGGGWGLAPASAPTGTGADRSMAEQSNNLASYGPRRQGEGDESARGWSLPNIGRTLLALAYLAGAAFNLAYTTRHPELFEEWVREPLLPGYRRAVAAAPATLPGVGPVAPGQHRWAGTIVGGG